MDSLFCCAARRRPRQSLNPLEGRANLRLQGRRDYDDVISREVAAEPVANCEEGQSYSSFTSSGNRLSVPEKGLDRNRAEDSAESTNGNDSDFSRSFKSSFENLGKVIAQGKAASRDASRDAMARETSPPRSPERALSSSSSSENGDADEGDADSDQQNLQLQDLAKKLQKTISKYPSSGKPFLGTGLKERFFAIKMSPAEAKTPTSLNYWEDEDSVTKEEPLGTIPISSITAVQWQQDTEKRLEVAVTHYKDGKQGPTMVLILKFANSKEAKAWSGELQNFVETFKRCSSSATEDKKPRPELAPVRSPSPRPMSPRNGTTPVASTPSNLKSPGPLLERGGSAPVASSPKVVQSPRRHT